MHLSKPGQGRDRRFVLDANALIAFFEDRQRASQKVRRIIGAALQKDLPVLMSAVNWGEVFYMEWRYHGEEKTRELKANVSRMPILIVEADYDRATRAAAIKQKHGLGYADAFAAELAMERGAWLVTADPEFAKVGKALSIYSLPRHGN